MFGSDTQRTYVKLNSKKQLKQFPVHNCLHYFCIGSDHEKTIMFQGLRAQKGHLSSWRRNFWARQHLHKGIPVSASLYRNQYIHILVCVGDFYGLTDCEITIAFLVLKSERGHNLRVGRSVCTWSHETTTLEGKICRWGVEHPSWPLPWSITHVKSPLTHNSIDSIKKNPWKYVFIRSQGVFLYFEGIWGVRKF